MTWDPKNAEIAMLDLVVASYEKATVDTQDAHALIDSSISGLTRIAMRGTLLKSWEDVWRDILSIGLRTDPILGRVPESFAGDAEQIYWRLFPALRTSDDIEIGGHSKGGAEAQALAAMMTHTGLKVRALWTYGAPPMGALGGILTGKAGGDFRHGDDPITDDHFRRGRPRGDLVVIPWVGPPPLNPLDYHAMEGYKKARAAQLGTEFT